MSASAQPSRTTSNATEITKELADLEHKYWDALKRRDVDAMLSLTANPCIVTGAQGVGSLDHNALRAMMTKSPWQLVDFTLSDLTTLRLTDDVAVTAYKVTEKLTVDGAPVTLEAADSSTWVRREGKWLCAVHTEAVAGDPFGRDHGNSPR